MGFIYGMVWDGAVTTLTTTVKKLRLNEWNILELELVLRLAENDQNIP